MAHFSFFLLLVVLFHSPQTEARLRYFYYQLPNSPFLSPSPSPMINEISQPPSGFEGVSQIAPTPTFEGVSEIAPPPVDAIDNAYGLYASSDFSNQLFNEGTTDKSTDNVAVDADGNEGFNQKTTENVVDDAFPSNGFDTESFKEVNNYNQNGYSNLPSTTNYFKNGGFAENYNDDGFVGRDGMSDTRFMENGKYYYDVQNGNKNQNDGYESVNRDGNNGGGYYGDTTKYEFESMDEYEREQGYPQSQNYYAP